MQKLKYQQLRLQLDELSASSSSASDKGLRSKRLEKLWVKRNKCQKACWVRMHQTRYKRLWGELDTYRFRFPSYIQKSVYGRVRSEALRSQASEEVFDFFDEGLWDEELGLEEIYSSLRWTDREDDESSEASHMGDIHMAEELRHGEGGKQVIEHDDGAGEDQAGNPIIFERAPDLSEEPDFLDLMDTTDDEGSSSEEEEWW